MHCIGSKLLKALSYCKLLYKDREAKDIFHSNKSQHQPHPKTPIPKGPSEDKVEGGKKRENKSHEKEEVEEEPLHPPKGKITWSGYSHKIELQQLFHQNYVSSLNCSFLCPTD